MARQTTGGCLSGLVRKQSDKQLFTNYTQMSFKKIKHYRELRNYTQEHVANELGISQSAYSRIEENPDKCSISRLKEIAAVLKISHEQLVKIGMYLTVDGEHFEKTDVRSSAGVSDAERKLYESTIQHLKEENSILRKEKLSLMECLKEALRINSSVFKSMSLKE